MRKGYAERREILPKAGGEQYKKFTVGKDPLELEDEIDVIKPLGEEEGKTFMKMLRKLLNEKVKRGDTVSANAVAVYMAQYEGDQLKGRVQKEFARDFVAWLRGRGKEKDHEKSWWYRASLLDDPECAHYIHMFSVKRSEFLLKLTRLAHRRPMGIVEHYLYFKYIVRGEPLDAVSFHHDNKLMLQETWDAINLDNQHPVVGAPHHHEVPPFDETKKKEAAQKADDRRDEQSVSILGPEGGGGGRGGGPRRRRAADDSDTDADDRMGEEYSDSEFEIPPVPEGRGRRVRRDHSAADGVEPMEEENAEVPSAAVDNQPVVDAIDRLGALLEAQAGRDVRLDQAHQVAIESRAELEAQKARILELENAKTSREIAKLPTDEAQKEIAAEKEKSAKMQGMLEQSQRLIDTLQNELKEQRDTRAREAADMKEMLDKYLQNVPRLEGKGKEEEDDSAEDESSGKQMTLHPDVEKSIKFQEDFMKRFEAYVGNMNQRESEMLEALKKRPESSGPLIEEIEEMRNQSAVVARALEDLPATLALGWKKIVEEQETKSSALIVAASSNSEASVAAWKKARDEDSTRFQAQLQNFADFMREMSGAQQGNMSKLMQEHEKQLDQLTVKMPQQNQTLLLEMRKELTDTFNKQLAVMSSPVQSELSEAIAMMQHNSNEMSQFLAAMQAASQRAAQAESMLQQAQAQAQHIQSDNVMKLQYLKNAAENANRVAQMAAQQAYVAQQQNQLNNQRLSIAMQQNQGLKQAMDSAAQQQHMLLQQFYNSTQGLMKQIGYLQQQKPQIPESSEPLSPQEKWVLRLEGGEQPMLLEGPKAAGGNAQAYQMPTYGQATVSKIKSEPQRALFLQVHELEKKIVELANRNSMVLDPELAHNLNVESVHPKVLETKLARYQAALASWGK